MYAPLRLAHSRAPRALVQRRLLSTTAPIRNSATPPPAAAGAASATIPPRPKKSFFRRLVVWTTVGALVFYPASAYLSTKNETYRDFFTKLPGGEQAADYADDHHWDQFGLGTVTKGAAKLGGLTSSTSEDVQVKLEHARKAAEAKASELSAAAKASAAEVQKKAIAAKDAAVAKAHELQHVAADAKDKAVDKASELSNQAAEKLSSAKDAVQDGAQQAAKSLEKGANKAASTASDGVANVIKSADNAINDVQKKVDIGETASSPNRFPDTQRPRELRPETVKAQKPTFEGKEEYKESLPIGFEPPPGYYLRPPPPKKQYADGEPLPLLVPKVKAIAGSEPVVAQLATTIDSLTSSLSSAKAGSAAKAAEILDRAQTDLAALNKRIDEVKKTEQDRLQQVVEKQADKFQETLEQKETEWKKDEANLKNSWEAERQKMVDGWREVLDAELESQRQTIEQRLREEVVSQGIELQRRWLRSIKSQVETERGGRLAKLDSLATSLKQLERITLDNSAALDDNVRLHKLWSALRAVQTKTDKGDVTFVDELRVLQSLTASENEAGSADTSVVRAALGQLEASGIAQTGVKSFAALSSWFTNSVAPRVQEASLVPSPEESGVASHLASIALSKFLFRPKAGLVEGKDVGAILARAEYALGEKDLDAATREINSLRGWPRKLADDWLREARRKLEVQQALDIVGTEATLSSLLMV